MNRIISLIPVALSNRLARICTEIAYRFETAANHLRRCPNCGESIFYGKPCRNINNN